MPLQTVTAHTSEGQDFDASELFTESGDLTARGEVVEAFLSEVDFNDFAADADVKEFVKTERIFVRESAGGYEECDQKADGAFEVEMEVIPGPVAAALIDEADLHLLWNHFVSEEMPQDTLEDKVRVTQVADMVDEDQLDEFKRGEFRKIRKGSPAGKAKVKSMLLAMLNKEAIKRVAKGTGYKKGDYAPAANWKFYPKGSKAGLAKVNKWRAANKAKVTAGQTKRGTKKVMKAQPATGAKKGAAKAAAKAKLFGGASKLPASYKESAMPAGQGPVLHEQHLAAAAIGRTHRRTKDGTQPLTETARR